jgi:hypothetical protein
MAAPASAAPIAPSAISSGVTGRCGLMDGVWIDPVIAQLMMMLSDAVAMAATARPVPRDNIRLARPRRGQA